MWIFIGRRLLLQIPQLIGISLVSFLLVRLMPGNPAYAIAGQLATQDQIEAIEQRMALDRPLPVQYVAYVSEVLHGDFGPSFIMRDFSVAELFRSGLPVSMTLGSLAIKVKGVLIMNWLLILGRYTARPGFYIYDKNSSAARSSDSSARQKRPEIVISPTATRQKSLAPALPPHEQFAIEALMNHPTSKLHFKTDKKGNLHVAISKAE